MSHDSLEAYAPRLIAEWPAADPAPRHRRLAGTMVFADISGFTQLTERLARRGRIGAELLSDTLDQTFARLLAPAFEDGADLLKWGGDAVLLLFRGDDHAGCAARAAHRMRAALRELVRTRDAELPMSAPLRMSIGIHSADTDSAGEGAETAGFDFFLVGDPASHRELIVAGPAVSHLARVEQAAAAGEILLSATAAARLPQRTLGAAVDVDGTGAAARLLRSRPEPVVITPRPAPWPAPPADGDPVPTVADTLSVAETLPPGIRSHLESGAAEPEHRPIAVGFVQFAGTDALLRERGPAAATAAIHEAVVAAQRACLLHGVTFFESDIAVDGGKIMLTAGAPRSAGRDAERMLRAAHDIAGFQGTLSVRVGVSAGHVFTGDFGPEQRRTYSVKGDAVNLAARLLGRAESGQVVATTQVVAAAHQAFDNTPLPAFTVKGKRAPVQAVVVGGERRGPAEVRIPFVGREAELSVMVAAAASASAGKGAVVDVVGDPGIGKSRLVAELDLRTALRTLSVTVSTYETATPYAAVGMLLRQALGIAAYEEPAAAAALLTESVREHAADLLRWLPLLGVPLGLDLPSTREVDELDPRFRRGRIEEATIALLAARLTEPVMLVIEDAHLMDEASGALLNRLEGEVPRQPWCLIVTRRETPLGYVPHLMGPDDTRIALTGVPPETALELLESAVGASRPSRHTMAAMAERAQGNPLFLTSLAANARTGDASGDLPASVEALLLVDIDRLDPADRTLLRLAAVLGARFDGGILVDAHAEPISIEGIAARLHEFVRMTEDGEIEFRHAMARDVAYAGLPFRLRRRMHERVAVVLQTRGDRFSAPDVLSLHFHAAGLHDQSWSYSLRAAEEARAKYAYAQAAAFFARALDSAVHLPDMPAERSSVALSLGECLDLAGDATGALAALRRARRGLEADVVATADVLHKEARITLRLGRYRSALGQLTRALRMLDAVEGTAADAVRARIATWYGFCLHLQNRDGPAVQWGRRAVAWAETSGDQEVLANACNALHLSYGASALVEDRPYGQMALGLYEKLEDLSGQALTLNNLAIDAYNAGRWNEAIDDFARVAARFHRLGDDADEATALYNGADVLVAQGRHEEALPLLAAALHLARRVDDEEMVGLALREQARAQSATGDLPRGWTSFGRARIVLNGLDLPTEVALLDAAHADALIEAGQVAEALTLLDSALPAAQSKAPDALARLHRVRAHALLAAGRLDEAVTAAHAGLARNTGTYGGYETALLRRALAAATQDEELHADSLQTLDALGVVR